MRSPSSHPSQTLDSGRSSLVLRLRSGRLSLRLDGRTLTLTLVLLGLIASLAVLSLLSGKYPIAPAQVLWALAGRGEDMVRMIVVEWRLPRVALAILLGAALGTSGAIFQSLTRNPLGSPDIIGFSAGSYTGALLVILMASGSYYETALGALVGGIVTATAVYLLAWRQGAQGFRLIIVGIGVAAMLSAFNAWMIREADLQVAMAAAIWGAGSLNGLGTEQLRPVALALCLLLPLTLLLSRPMRQLELGEEIACASGVNAGRSRLLLMVLGVALTALVTATAGPISFIALCAPQIARRLTRSAGVALLFSGLTGGAAVAFRRLGCPACAGSAASGRRDDGQHRRVLLPLSSHSRGSQMTKSLSVSDRLYADTITLRYDERTISRELSITIPDGAFTVIVGPNACGKSTLLRALSRLLAPAAGQVILDGRSLRDLPPKEVARRLGLLPQSSSAPEGITVADLVSRGRYPHQSFLRQWSKADEEAVIRAMEATRVAELSGRLVHELSGGQRQRVWIAMVLAQETPILLLDEPTTFLDIAHQIELMELLADLNAAGRTIVAVLHDLNQACRYATHLIAMKDGAVLAEGQPSSIVTEQLVEEVFGLASVIIRDPVAGSPLIVPRGRAMSADTSVDRCLDKERTAS